MEGQHALELITTGWGIVMALSPAIQIRRMLRTRSSADVSIGYFGVLIVGFALWASYGVSIDSWILYLCNSIAAVVGVITIAIALRLRGGPASTGAAVAGLRVSSDQDM